MPESDNYYNLYVDASGCDGFQFNHGSTRCYAVAVLLIKKSNEQYNKSILLNIKKLLNVKVNDEVKYSTLKKHKNSISAHQLMGQLKGEVIAWVAFKTRLSEKEKRDLHIETKFLTKFVHSFPLDVASRICISRDIIIDDIYIDKMKHVEELGVVDFINQLNEEAAITSETVQTKKPVFVDSKAVKLIQMADFYAGCIRDFFDCYDLRKHWLPCKLCSPYKGLCQYKRKNYPLEDSLNFRSIKHLFYSEDISKGIFPSGLAIVPFSLWNSFKFIDCLFYKYGPY